MTIEELNDKSLFLIEGFRRTKESNFSNRNTIISTKIFTDGEITPISEYSYKTNYYYLNNKMYALDFATRKEIKVSNCTYVLIYFVAKEEKNINNEPGIFEVIKDKKLYISNISDKNLLKNIRNTIQNIENEHVIGNIILTNKEIKKEKIK